MNNARKLTLLENAIRRLGEEVRQGMTAADIDEIEDLKAWHANLNDKVVWRACEGGIPEIANLIAAAPDMYEALETIHSEITALLEDGTVECSEAANTEGWLKLCAALAKAQGES